MELWLWAAFWGGVAGAALLIGSALGYFFPFRQRSIAGIMAFGSGVLISALSFELMDEAHSLGGFIATATGFLSGAVIYTGANYLVSAYGGKHRKRSGEHQVKESESSSSGLSIAIGALIDGIPESIVIGLGMIHGGTVSIVAVSAIFISNIPEGLSSSAGMKKSGRSKLYIFGIWTTIAVLSAIASLFGYVFFQGSSPQIVAVVMAIAAGAILCMLVDTMIPEAFADTHNYAGLITVTGFLAAFCLEKAM